MIETERAKEEFDLLKLRQDEINELEKTIEDIHDMFCDMAYLIASQVTKPQIDRNGTEILLRRSIISIKFTSMWNMPKRM